MKRWHDDETVMVRQSKLWGISVDSKKPLGKFRKKHAHDCGKPNCMVCHCEKVLGVPLHRNRIADLSAKEQIEGA